MEDDFGDGRLQADCGRSRAWGGGGGENPDC
jgi:hypothetical protein